MAVPLLDLKAQYQSLRAELDAAVLAVMESQVFIGGPEVEACEAALADYCRVEHAIGVSSGTDALLLALMAEGIGPGDEVITSPFTFFATGGCIHRVGATPVFVDILPETFNIDPRAVAAAITPRTRALMPVHLFGQCADMDPLLDHVKMNGLTLFEDAAQAIGAESRGRRAGTMGDYGCFSFFPSKNLGGAGDGGMVSTGDAEKAKRLRRLRNHGSEPKYYHRDIGGNFRLDAIQAAVVRVKLRHLDRWTEARQRNAALYDRLFEASGLADGPLRLPSHPPLTGACSCRHVFNQYTLRAERRDALRAFLLQRGIGHEVYYPVPLHLQECFAFLGYAKGSLPESERAANEVISLPIYPELGEARIREVVGAISDFYRA